MIKPFTPFDPYNSISSDIISYILNNVGNKEKFYTTLELTDVSYDDIKFAFNLFISRYCKESPAWLIEDVLCFECDSMAEANAFVWDGAKGGLKVRYFHKELKTFIKNERINIWAITKQNTT